MTGILGRMAAESGKLVTWDEAISSDLVLAPGLEKIASLDDPRPSHPTPRASIRSPCRGSPGRSNRYQSWDGSQAKLHGMTVQA